ncbi:MAG: T9SS type A sorting domain-containing protein [Prevotellaceae bacterium]|jgi:hypothetical protein|nr:T9SS type A sorting domain-containing protein [Prevotellaceae bacterium]
MKKNILTAVSTLLMTISAFAYSGGNGSEMSPYLISSTTDVLELASNVNNGEKYAGVYFLLTTDLTSKNDTITVTIGNYSSDYSSYYFSGIFDGNNHKVAVNKYALFGNIKQATIKNLTVSGRVTHYSLYRHSSSGSETYYYFGGICAYAEYSNIQNCQNTSSVNVFKDYTSFYSGECEYVGGICGYANKSCNIINCYNTGNLSSPSYSSSSVYFSYIGGICGEGDVIQNCYNTGNLSGMNYVGGIAGGRFGTVKNCFVGNCDIKNRSAARIGRINNGGNGSTCENNYAYAMLTVNGKTVSNTSTTDKNGKDCTEENLQDQTWLTTNLQWDFDQIWDIPIDGGYPVLRSSGSSTSIDDVQSASTITIYPNPTSGIVNLPEAMAVKVFSLQGALLQQTVGTQVDLSAYPQGVYLLQVGGQMMKVVKE